MNTATEHAEGEAAATGHLEYYLRHGLNPVRYEMADLGRHLQRRASLYRCLGLVPLTFRNARVLEVAAGSGQNSLYVAGLRPRQLVLVEPNPTAVRDIKALYSRPDTAPVRPQLVECRLEDFHTDDLFDIVLCENWLGHTPAERRLLQRLTERVAPEGILVLTTVAPVGLVPNVLRRALVTRLTRPNQSFAERSRILCHAFAPHLATVSGMTRTPTDWVQDNLLNPAFFQICLSIPLVLHDLGSSFDVLASCPHFATDWRWFKTLHGSARNFNGHFLDEYQANVHTFLDHRQGRSIRDTACNRQLEDQAWDLYRSAADLDRNFLDGSAAQQTATKFLSCLEQIAMNLVDQPASVGDALREFGDLFARPAIAPDDVANMGSFRGLFGRETVYVSLQRSSMTLGNLSSSDLS